MSAVKHAPGAARAAAIYRQRQAEDLAHHRERVEWLTSASPRWACGTLVESSERRVLLAQSLAYIASATGEQQ